MRGLPDAINAASGHDDGMDANQPTDGGWPGQVEQLLVHGRDREAAELAARHLRDDRTTATPTRGDNTMGPLEQLDELEPLLGHVAAGIMPDDLDARTPCVDFTVRGVLGHMIGGATQFAAAFRGESPPDVSPDVAEGADVVARAGSALAGLMEAIRSPGALERTVAAPFGEVPGDTFARFVVLDGLVHGWDMAVATGQRYEPSDTFVAEVDAFARQAISPAMRDDGMFAGASEPADGATPIERLAAFTGRTT
jgi:uncharacterized protein (TIGR03086 family)